MVIGVTDCSKYKRYAEWMSSEPDVQVIKLGYKQKNLDDVGKCDGVLLTGGEDVYPDLYGHPEYLELCHQDDVDRSRDEFELRLLERTQSDDVAVLGICRGLQIANVFFGGTLVPDLMKFGKPDHSKINGADRYHHVDIVGGTRLSVIVGVSGGEINSAHHQAADTPGSGLQVSARSGEIIEGLEWANPASRPYLVLVQWHPERMLDQGSPMVSRIKKDFLNHVKQRRLA